MNYCTTNQSIIIIGLEETVSQCVIDTTLSTITLAFAISFAILNLCRRTQLKPSKNYNAPLTFFFSTQVSLTLVLMPLAALTTLVLKLSNISPSDLDGIKLLIIAKEIFTWPVITWITLRERKSATTRHHSLGLKLLSGWMLIDKNCTLLVYWTQDFIPISDDPAEFSIFIFQCVGCALVFILMLISPGMIPRSTLDTNFNEQSPLIGRRRNSKSYTEYDNYHLSTSTQGSYLTKLRVLIPFLWPRKSLLFQFYAFLCLVLFILGRFANTFVPIYSKRIVDSMSVPHNSSHNGTYLEHNDPSFHMQFRWDLILIYVLLKVVQGGVAGSGGLITSLTNLLWINVQQYTARELEVTFFKHLHSLTLRWHLHRKTGEVLRAMDRGTESFNNILNYVIFNILPTLIDVIVAVIYFTLTFNGIFGFIVFLTIIIYLLATFTMTEWRTKVNRAKNKVDNEKKQMSLDSLINFETIKNYANEDFEKERYLSMVQKYQVQEWYFNLSLSLNDMVQLTVINFGLLAGSLLCVKGVSDGELSVGDYVLFASYLIQLFEPLNNFGKYYKSLQRSFVDLENLLDVLREEAEIKDCIEATPLKIVQGSIEFRDVSFRYLPGKKILNGVSFFVPPGSSVALVGPSGSGKTTITRLLLRLYDTTSGQILIDGQDVKHVTQRSIRKAIGIVPQDSVLFNESLKYNIKYGCTGAGNEDMFEAAELACIHEKIIGFPRGYETKVGERGLKLSGGEKQRVAIARTVLKRPAIVVLDEATSSLDTQTERQIQASIQRLCENRTSVVVAHRLSTILNVDQILVLKEGRIVERGSHERLLWLKGLYASMWNDQLKREE